jgi:hypothetical protein
MSKGLSFSPFFFGLFSLLLGISLVLGAEDFLFSFYLHKMKEKGFFEPPKI